MFNFQSNLLKSEGIIGQLATMDFQPAIESTYFTAGMQQQVEMLDFIKFLSSPACASVREEWAMQGLLNLMLGKKKESSNVPLLWTLRGNSITAWMKHFLPYIQAVNFNTLVAKCTEIQNACGFQAPAGFVMGLKEAATATKRNTSLEQMLLVLYFISSISVMHTSEITGKTSPVRTFMFTNSSSALQLLSNSGTVGNPEALATAYRRIAGTEDEVVGETLKDALDNKYFAAVALNFADGVYTSKTRAIDITKTANISMLPIRLMLQYCEGLLTNLSQTKFACVTCKLHTDEVVNYAVTTSPAAYMEAYAECGDLESAKRRSATPIGFSLRKGQLVLLNLESSIHSSSGIAHINPRSIVQIVPISLADINRSLQGISPASIKGTFQSCLGKQINTKREAIIDLFMHSDFEYARKRISALTREDIACSDLATVIVQITTHSHYKVLYNQMLAHPELFDDISNSLASVTPAGGMKTVILKGKTVEARVAELKEYVANNVVYIRYETKTGESAEAYVTSNNTLLAKNLGADYKLKFEAKGVQYAELKNLIVSKNITDKSVIATVLDKYHIDLDINELQGTTEADIQAWIDAKVASAKPRKAPTYAPEMISVRNIRAISKSDYWKMININKIQAISI